jgi:hypothetical protein
MVVDGVNDCATEKVGAAGAFGTADAAGCVLDDDAVVIGAPTAAGADALADDGADACVDGPAAAAACVILLGTAGAVVPVNGVAGIERGGAATVGAVVEVEADAAPGTVSPGLPLV